MCKINKKGTKVQKNAIKFEMLIVTSLQSTKYNTFRENVLIIYTV